MAIITATCRKCGALTEVYSSTKWCRSCQAAYYREWRKKNPEKAKARDAKDREKRVEYFRQKAREQQARLTDEQRRRKREYQRRWYQRNKADLNARNKEWQSAHRDAYRFILRKSRALKHGVVYIPFTAEQLAAKLAYWGNRCWVCGIPASHTDHVKPLKKGGAHALANIRPICPACNTKKRDSWPFAP